MPKPRIPLFPKSSPYNKGYLPTGDGHRLYYERHGNPDSPHKVVYMHGGPGAGCSYNEYRWFDPRHFDLLLYDQRWAPRSRPAAYKGTNNLKVAISDVEKLRRAFGAEKWIVAGASWGTTLAMLYAARHPERVSRMLLRAIFFGDIAGSRHITEETGAGAKKGKKWFAEYRDFIPEKDRAKGLYAAYHKQLQKGGRTAVEAARLFLRWDISIVTSRPRPSLINACDVALDENLALARTYFHFATSQFSDTLKREIVTGMKKLKAPVDIIHGDQDHICPVAYAHELHKACRNSRLHVIKGAGHGWQEKDIQKGLVKITNSWVREDRRSGTRKTASR